MARDSTGRGVSRRGLLRGIGATVAGAGVLSSVSTPVAAGEDYPNSDKDAVVGSPSDDGPALAAVNQYPSYDDGDWYGTLIEDCVGARHDVPMIQDLHVMLWDADLGQTLDVRNDAAGSELAYEDPKVPEAHLHNWFYFSSGYRADLYQDVVAAVDRTALLVRNEVSFEQANDHTLFTLLNPDLDSYDSGGDGDEAWVTTANGYEAIVARDGSEYVAYAQRRPATGTTGFDGHRIGVEGETSGDDESAWNDVYAENDGWIDSNDYNSGNVDTGVGLYVGDDTDVTWLTGIGFGASESAALDNATAVLDDGYAATRDAFATAWRDWHDGVRSAPTGDGTADATYELSLSAIKAAQDPRGPTIAGLFEPHGDGYTYVWPRDQVIMIQALLSAGATADARAALSWLDDAQINDDTYHESPTGEEINRKGTWWQNYFVDGAKHWEMLQLDQVGGPIYAHWLTWRATDSDAVLDDHYGMSKLAAEFLLGFDDGSGVPKKHNDPWEENWGYTTEGTAAAIAGLRCMADLAAAKGEDAFAADCRDRADTWASNFDDRCFETDAYLGDHYVTCAAPEWDASAEGEPGPAERPDAAAFMAHWPWNVRAADAPEMAATVRKADDDEWSADGTPCLGRYPGDDYTPSGDPADGGWPLTEAYADVVRQRGGFDDDAVATYVFDDAPGWRTAAGLLPERVDGDGDVAWNANLNWSQAMYVLLTETYRRGSPYGYAPES